MRVLLDSSVLTDGDWGLTGAAAQALLAASERNRLPLVVPEIVIREVTNSQGEREQAAINKVNAEQRKLRRLQDHFSIGPPVVASPPPVRDAYAERLRERLEKARVQIPDLPDLPHDRVVDRALARRRPFDSEGHKGYRDTLIWHNALDLLGEGEELLFVTRDGDFLAKDDKGKLHEHLLDDLAEHEIDASLIRICDSLETAVEVTLEPAQEILEKLRRQLDIDIDFRERLEQELEGLALDTYSIEDGEVEIAIDSEFQPFSDDLEEQELEDVYGLGVITFNDAHQISGDRFVVTADVTAEASYRLLLSTSGFWRDPRRVPANLDLTADERHAYLRGSAKVILLLRAEYDSGADKLGELELEQMISDPS
jgi:predicted nucleic acid-binding protein